MATTAHTRRNDEVDITWCDQLLPVNDAADLAPVPMGMGTTDVAIFDDVELPAGTTPCAACWTASL